MKETLDNIVTWLRSVAQNYRNALTATNHITVEGLDVASTLEEIADRIEAATRENHFHYETYEEALSAFIKQVQGTVKVDPDDAFGRWLFSEKVEVGK